MTPVYNYTHQQKTTSLPLAKPAETERILRPVEEKEKEEVSLFALAIAKEVSDPEQWDEAWFSNYE